MDSLISIGLWLASGLVSYLVCYYVAYNEVKFNRGVLLIIVALGPLGLPLIYLLGLLFHKMGLYE